LKKNLLILCLFSVFLLSCRGGGANPSNNASIPIIEPTPSSMYCQNEIYVESYPQLDELSSNQLLSDESGIEYFIFDEGEIEKPNLDYLVTAKYTGWLENGCVFDSSYTRNTDSVFPLDRVIKGWQLGLSKIGKNGKILIKIPPNLGYGTQGAPPRIPGNSTLFFFVELVDLQSFESYMKEQENNKK
tara:strand:+ start:835 stop:1395 length:561 start_codon:yes stop_codon:yes gene_type:complete